MGDSVVFEIRDQILEKLRVEISASFEWVSDILYNLLVRHAEPVSRNRVANVVHGADGGVIKVDERLRVGLEPAVILLSPVLSGQGQTASRSLHVDEHRIERSDVVEPVAELNDIAELLALPVFLNRVEQEINFTFELEHLVLEILVEQAVGKPGMVVVRSHGN